MPTKVQCPNPKCRTVYNVPERPAGRTGQCKRCDTKFPLPTAGPGLPKKIDRYEIRELLGSGAFGTVYRAFDPRLQRDVALKVLRPEATASAEAVERFLREARAAARLHHPHIVPVHDTGRSGGAYFIASAFIKGRTLASATPDGGLDPRQAAELTAQLASALAYAHRQGVLHRDIKPQNTLLDEDGALHLLDFGLARWAAEETTRLTQTGGVLGTPAYMAPEQAAGEADKVGPATDLYGAGAVLYHLLTGRPPFEGGQLATLVYQIVHTEPAPPSRRRPGLDAGLETICLRALAKEPARRYSGGDEMATALRSWLGVLTPAQWAQALPVATPMAGLPTAGPAATAGAVPKPSVWDRETVLNEFERPTLTPRPGRAPQQPPDQGKKRREDRSIPAWLLWGLSLLVVMAGLAAIFIYEFTPPDVKADFQAYYAAGLSAKGSESFIRENAPKRRDAWEAAAKAGVPEGQCLLARCYDLGAGGPKDLPAAAAWYHKAALQGNTIAQNNLGACYLRGDGFDKPDPKQAVTWFRKAADQGYPWAQHNLGVCYDNGDGFDKPDPKQAVIWYRKAADQDFAPAEKNLGWCYQSGDGFDKPDPKQAVIWFRKAADQGYAMAQNNLGACYLRGDGFDEPDPKQAVTWFRKAADQGEPWAQKNLGECYERGAPYFDKADTKTAFELYLKAAGQGSEAAQYAQFYLGRFYLYAIPPVTEKDPKKAKEWFQKSADNGYEPAKEELKKLIDNP